MIAEEKSGAKMQFSGDSAFVGAACNIGPWFNSGGATAVNRPTAADYGWLSVLKTQMAHSSAGRCSYIKSRAISVCARNFRDATSSGVCLHWYRFWILWRLAALSCGGIS